MKKRFNLLGLSISWGNDSNPSDYIEAKAEPPIKSTNSNMPIPPGRVSVPNDANSIITTLGAQVAMVDTDFNREYIPLIRKIYKVNPDVSIALQDTFKLANTGHTFIYPYNDDDESAAMNEHLLLAQKNWTTYTAGIDGLVNKMMVQALVGGAISIEGVPSKDLDKVSTILFIKPEEIYFKRENNGVYTPYQINKTGFGPGVNKTYVKLNTNTYRYIGVFSDVDEPNGVPPFMAALDALLTQADMKANFKEIMAVVGMLGFLEVKTSKPTKSSNESEPAYIRRLDNYLLKVKKSVKEGMKDGVVVGYDDDHEFKMNATAKDVGNIDRLWELNQQSVANGLSTTGALIGVNNQTSEGGTGILLSKMISQLKNIQTIAGFALEFIYELELKLAGFNCKGVKVKFNTTTIADEVKLQQAIEYQIRNLKALYIQGIISQNQFATIMGYLKPHLPEPLEMVDPDATGPANSKDRIEDKKKSDRGTRDKSKVVPKRAEQDPRARGR